MWLLIQESKSVCPQGRADLRPDISEPCSVRPSRCKGEPLYPRIEVTEDGKKVKCLSVPTENVPTYEVRVAGEKIDPWFLFDKLLRDFFQYTMNTFDSISQIINAGILAKKGKKVDSVDIQIRTRCFNQQTYSADFPKMQAWLNKISQSPEFQYIEAINNRTKHTRDIANKLAMGILGSSNKAEIGPFFRKGIQYGKNELSVGLE